MYYFKILLVASLSAFSLAFSVEDCPIGLKRDKYLKVFGDSCYRFVTNEDTSFHKATIRCFLEGGHLAIVAADEDNSFLKTNLISLGMNKSPAWIGLKFGIDNKEVFSWTNGNAMTYNNLPSDPLSHGGKCVGLESGSTTWKISKCDTRHSFICQYPAGPPPTIETTITTADCPSNLVKDKYLAVYGDKCYRFEMEDSVRYTIAKTNCAKKGGNLVTIESESVNYFLRNQVFKTYQQTKPLWIGLRFYGYRETFEWVDGSEATYLNHGSFAKLMGADCFALNPKSGKWDLYQCGDTYGIFTETHPYICEYAPNL